MKSSIGRGRVEEHLVTLGLEVLSFYVEMVPLQMMSWSNRDPDGSGRKVEKPNARAVNALKRVTLYFEAEMRLGRLRKHDPEVVARTFLGALNSHAMLEVVHHVNVELPIAAESFVRGLVKLLWSGLEPIPVTESKKKRR